MRIPSELPQGAAAEIFLWSTGTCLAILKRICFLQHCLPAVKLVSSVPSTSKFPTEHNKALHRTAPPERWGGMGKGRKRHQVWILTHALPVSPCCFYSSSLFSKVWRHKNKKVHYKLCEALGVEVLAVGLGRVETRNSSWQCTNP